jgi:hypothetical protein
VTAATDLLAPASALRVRGRLVPALLVTGLAAVVVGCLVLDAMATDAQRAT